MTIQNRQLNDRLSRLQRCAELAPEGTYTEAKSAAQAVDEAIEAVRSIMREHGFKVNGTDPCRDLEAAVYGYLLISNPDAYGLITGEGFGEHVDGPAGERIMAQAAINAATKR
jgi:hypothetical protein